MCAGSLRWMKVPKPESLHDVGRPASAAMPARQAARPRGREVLQHAGMLQHEGHAGAGGGEARRPPSARRRPAGRSPAIVGQPRDVALHRGIARRGRGGGEAVERVLVPVELLADAAHPREAGQPVERRARIRHRHVGIGDDGVRPAGFQRDVCSIQAPRPRPGRRPVGLDIDRLATPVPAMSARYSAIG
jgi:hypothetical protein